jgi:RNA-binding protein
MEKSKRTQLRKIGHPMRPLMRVGKSGVSDGFVTELVRSLTAHQLVKVSMESSQKEEARAQAEDLAARAECDLVDLVGSSALFYRENPKDPLVRG